MLKFKYFILIGLMMLPLLSIAMPFSYPKSLLYKGKPINPLCFSPQASHHLKQCGIKEEPNLQLSGHNQTLLREGFIGADYNYIDKKNNTTLSGGSSYYKVIAPAHHGYIIFSIYNGGGSGSFTTLLWVKRSGDKLQITSLATGDRAQGGIFDVRHNNQTLTYRRWLTPHHLIALTQKEASLYKDLPDCMVCMTASAEYQYQLNQRDLGKELLVAIDLGKDMQPLYPHSNAQTTCFTQITNDYIKKGKRYLNTKTLKSFTQSYIDCLHKK